MKDFDYFKVYILIYVIIYGIIFLFYVGSE